MKKISLLNKVFYLLAFLSISSSIISNYRSNEDFTWQIVAMLWMLSSYVNELRINNLQEKV